MNVCKSIADCECSDIDVTMLRRCTLQLPAIATCLSVCVWSQVRTRTSTVRLVSNEQFIHSFVHSLLLSGRHSPIRLSVSLSVRTLLSTQSHSVIIISSVLVRLSFPVNPLVDCPLHGGAASTQPTFALLILSLSLSVRPVNITAPRRGDGHFPA